MTLEEVKKELIEVHDKLGNILESKPPINRVPHKVYKPILDVTCNIIDIICTLNDIGVEPMWKLKEKEVKE